MDGWLHYALSLSERNKNAPLHPKAQLNIEFVTVKLNLASNESQTQVQVPEWALNSV